MSGSKVNTYGIGDANIQALMLSTDKLFKGFHKVSLTNYDSTSESQIAAGSVIECAGALYKFDSNESMTGSPSDGTVYIRIVPGLTTCTAEYTNTAPTWSDAYQGWYGTGAAVTYRYLEFIITLDTESWENKRIMLHDKNIDTIEINYGGVPFMGFDITKTPLYMKIIEGNLDGSGDVDVAHGIATADSGGRKILFASVIIDSGIIQRMTSLAYNLDTYYDDTYFYIRTTYTTTLPYKLCLIYI